MLEVHDAIAALIQVRDLRALLDLSYSRERMMFTLLKQAEWLLETASVAPDREAKVPEFKSKLAELHALVSSRPTANHGLLMEVATIQCELAAAVRANQELTAELRRLGETNRTLHDSLLKTKVELEEANAAWSAAKTMFRGADHFDVVTGAARDVLRARRT